MREDCRHFESRSYDDGETARFCVLDLAPEQPWRCPENCPKYERSVIDSTFDPGTLARTPVEDEPEESPEAIGDLFDDAETILEDAEPSILARARRRAAREAQVVAGVEAPAPGDDGGDDWHLSSR